MKKIVAVILSAIVMSSCAAKTGNQFLDKSSKQDVERKLIKGVTTKEEVRATFGDPSDADMLIDGTEQWVYSFTRSSAKGVNYIPYAKLMYSGTNDDIKKLKILFDKCGKVINYIHSTSKGETKGGLFQ